MDWPTLPENAGRDTEKMLADLRERPAVESIARIRSELQQTMDDDCGVYRTADGLRRQVDRVGSFKERYAKAGIGDKSSRWNTDLLEAVELGFMLDLAEVMVTGAEARKESRGGHYRGDFTSRDDENFLAHTFAWSGDAGVKLDYKPVVIKDYTPTERKY